MKNKIISKRKIIGICLFLLGVFLLSSQLFPNQAFYKYLILIFILIISVGFIIYSTRSEKNRKLIIPGISFSLLSLFILSYFVFFNNYPFEKIWPIIGLFPAISLIVYYLISPAKSPSTIVPGIFIGIMSSVIFIKMNFENDNISFQQILLIIISSMIILSGLGFMFSKKIRDIKKHLKANDNEEE